MAETDFDVAVVGGGIHGAGVAQAAAAAGYRTLLIEQTGWAAGTSSRSSKLLHGGLRYLETAQFGLVRESLRERNLLLQELAPSLSRPLRFNVPIYRDTRRRPWQLWLGLGLYALLSGLSPLSRFGSRTREAPAGLRRQGLQRVFSYWDGQTDDAHLTRAVVRSAAALGVVLRCPVSLTQARQEADGYLLHLQGCADDGRQEEVRCRFLVNCAGPWVNSVLEQITPAPLSRHCDLVKGSHLVLREQVADEAFYLEAPADGRAVFLLPWGEHSLLGTTEKLYQGNPQTVAVTADERDYLLATARHYFPEQHFTPLEEFAGLRVLPTGGGSAFARPRDCVLHSDPAHPRLLSLYGGKLTTYRKTAEKVLRSVQAQLGPRPVRADTASLPLQADDSAG